VLNPVSLWKNLAGSPLKGNGAHSMFSRRAIQTMICCVLPSMIAAHGGRPTAETIDTEPAT